jgi:hypothetical protein
MKALRLPEKNRECYEIAANRVVGENQQEFDALQSPSAINTKK